MAKSRLNLILYSLLLILTPFLLLQNYLQDSIGRLSGMHFQFLGYEIKFMLLLLLMVVLSTIILLIKNYTSGRLAGTGIILLLFLFAYNTTDYYFNHHFYDIQYNWHYFAYAIFSYVAWRYFYEQTQNVESTLIRVFFLAMSTSLFDEIIQVYISNRVFDLSDVGKDLWGSLIGLIFIQFVLYNGKYLSNKPIWIPGIKNWGKSAVQILILELFFTAVLLYISSVLSDSKYISEVIIFVLFIFLLLVSLFQFAIKKNSRLITLILILLVTMYTAINIVFVQPRISYPNEKLVVYNNMPLIYFDFMILPNGCIRLVDKKTSFNVRDKQKIESIGADIVIIGSGQNGEGGKGYKDQSIAEFRYNSKDNVMYQVIKLPNSKAFELYNKLIQEGKKVLLITHNS